jgi:hypothetical protein
MNVEEIEIHAGSLDRPYRAIGPIKAVCRAGTSLSKAPDMAEVNHRLREKALKLGASAVINVAYKRGVSLLSWKELRATGSAVVVESDEMPCPVCAATIKRRAKRCRFCGSDVEPAAGGG